MAHPQPTSDARRSGGPLAPPIAANWSGNIRFRAGTTHRPTSVEQLQQLVADTPRIRAVGTAHSFNSVADTTAHSVVTRHLGEPAYLETDGTLNAAAGASYSDVIDVLRGGRRALTNLGSLPHISLAGAAATGTHGSGVTNTCLATAVRGVELVRADGELTTVDGADRDFAGSVLALGAVGVATRLRLATVPHFAMCQRVWCSAPRESTLGRIDDIMSSAYSVSIFLRATRSEVVDQIWVKSKVGGDSDIPDGRAWGASEARAPVHMLEREDPRACSPQFGTHDWFDVLPHFRAAFKPSSGNEQQSEYFVDLHDAAAATDAVTALDLGDVVQVIELRAVAADQLWLSPMHQRDSLAIHFTWRNDDLAVRRACELVEAALERYRPRPHWGKVFTDNVRPTTETHPGLSAFRELAERADPNRKFGNEFLDAYVY